ncbi:MAG: PAS domain S-box protein [Candidatus Zixiibacteriota bacterium]|nr:MAG: PAS domain S-box protein [candidate division Zixibacteria bacterium]
MEETEKSRRLGWFLPLKLASYVILMAVVVGWMGFPNYLQLQVILYSILTLAFTVTIALDKRLRLDILVLVLITLQFLAEISIETGVIYATGNVNSPFSALFILTIVSAALAYRLVGTLLAASLVSVAYAFIIWLGLTSSTDSEISMQALRTIFSSQESVFYSIFLHILIFYLVAFISGYLAERLSTQDRELAAASRELRRAKLETDEILRHLNSGLLTIDSRGIIVYFNRAAEKILGYTEEQARGMDCREVFAERMPAMAAYLTDGLSKRVAYPRKELEIVDRDFNHIPLGLSTSILTEEGYGLRGVIAIFSDLTEAKALEAKVRAADRLAAVGELSASIAHEIRNPLAAISGSVQVLRNELSVDGENRRLMDLIVKESDRLTSILTDFLTYSRVTPPVYTKVELCHIVSEVIELLRHDDSCSDDVDILLEADEAIVYVVGDEGQIKQLLMNLGLNACQAFNDNGGEVVFHIVLDPLRCVVELYVRDNGPGIPEEYRDRIFEPFYSTKREGTGLGLAIVHRIASALQVPISVDTRVGDGTTFLLQFQGYSVGNVRHHGARQAEFTLPASDFS